MNGSDYVVLALIGLCAVAGLIKGFVMSVYRVVSFFVCIFASIKFYPILAKILEKTPVYGSIRNAVMKNLDQISLQTFSSSTQAVSGTAGAEAMMGPLGLPGFFKKIILEKLPSPSELIDMQSITDAIGDELAKTVLAVLSLIILYIILRAILGFAGVLLKGISKLPVFKQVDKLGGFVFGAVQGFLILYIAFSLLLLFNSNPQFAAIFDNIDHSLFARQFYENNLIINWMFPSSGVV